MCGCGHVGRCGMVTVCMQCPGQLRSVRMANQGKALLAAQQQGDCVSAGHLVARRSSIRTYVRTYYVYAPSKLGNTRTSSTQLQVDWNLASGQSGTVVTLES